MARAVFSGANNDEIDGVEIKLIKAFDADVEHLLWANALILGTPENFGYMSGGMKDFLDRTFYPCEGKIEGMPFSLFVSAGNDGTNAIAAIRRIGNGYKFREVQDPVLHVGEVNEEALERCTELGMSMSAGLELGIY